MPNVPAYQDLRKWLRQEPPQVGSESWHAAIHSLLDWIVEVRDGHPVARATAPWANEPLESVPLHLRPALKGHHKVCVLQVEGGWLAGIDDGEFGGGLHWIPRDGPSKYPIATRLEPICSLIPAFGLLFALEGLAHLNTSTGRVLNLRRRPEDRWVAEVSAALEHAPMAGAVDHEGLLVVVTTDQLVRLHSHNQVEVLIDAAFWSGQYPNSMAVDRNGDILIGMRAGVARVFKEGERYSAIWLFPADESAERSRLEWELEQRINRRRPHGGTR